MKTITIKNEEEFITIPKSKYIILENIYKIQKKQLEMTRIYEEEDFWNKLTKKELKKLSQIEKEETSDFDILAKNN